MSDHPGNIVIRRIVRVVVGIAPIVAAVGFLAAPAQAGTTNTPQKSGSSAAGHGYGYSSSDFHDIDTASCSSGCSWNDQPVNTHYSAAGDGYAYRPRQSGVSCYWYRHQSSDGAVATNDLCW